jgi:hypothetical protein
MEMQNEKTVVPNKTWLLGLNLKLKKTPSKEAQIKRTGISSGVLKT